MQGDNKSDRYTYEEAGYNGFFRRSIGSQPGSNTLSAVSYGRKKEISFDQAQVSGSMGDTLRIGRINLRGKDGNIGINDDRGEEMVRLGEQDG